MKYGIPKLYETMEELFADPEIDIVLNLTRPYQHFDVSKAALLAGKHVYSEKPLGISFEEGSELESIGEYAFMWCTALEGIEIPAGVTSIGEGAFSYCSKLDSVENIEHVSVVGDYAFAYTALTSVDLTGAISIGDFAFLKEKLTKKQYLFIGIIIVGILMLAVLEGE